MKFFVLYIGALFLFMVSYGVSVAQAQEELFFETLYDVPIMPELEEVPDMALSFDQAEGRISQAAAVIVGNVGEKEVLDFYGISLSQMGWRKSAEGVFVREGEKLEISTEKTEDSHIIHFLLQPY